MVYFSTYGNPLYSTSDLRQIRYTTHMIDLLARGFTSAIWTCGRSGRGLYHVLVAALDRCENSHLNYCRLNYGTFELFFVWIVHLNYWHDVISCCLNTFLAHLNFFSTPIQFKNFFYNSHIISCSWQLIR